MCIWCCSVHCHQCSGVASHRLRVMYKHHWLCRTSNRGLSRQCDMYQEASCGMAYEWLALSVLPHALLCTVRYIKQGLFQGRWCIRVWACCSCIKLRFHLKQAMCAAKCVNNCMLAKLGTGLWYRQRAHWLAVGSSCGESILRCECL